MCQEKRTRLEKFHLLVARKIFGSCLRSLSSPHSFEVFVKLTAHCADRFTEKGAL
jgi:hypothetical protein